jgi:PTS system ascorbate-specific IIA component
VLTNALNECSVTVCAEAGDWRAAVEISGGLLVTSGAAEEGYVSAMVRTVEELGAYAVITPRVAIPHARPEDGAKR